MRLWLYGTGLPTKYHCLKELLRSVFLLLPPLTGDVLEGIIGGVASHLVFYRWRWFWSTMGLSAICWGAIIITKHQMAAHGIEVAGFLRWVCSMCKWYWQVQKTNFHLLKCDIGIVLYVEEWEYLSFQSHFHILHLPWQFSCSKASIRVVVKWPNNTSSDMVLNCWAELLQKKAM